MFWKRIHVRGNAAAVWFQGRVSSTPVAFHRRAAYSTFAASLLNALRLAY